MNKDILLETIDFQKIYTQYEIAELLKVKHSSRIGSSLNGTESFKIPNPAGRGAKLKAYYGKGLKEAIYFGKFDWALSRNTLIPKDFPEPRYRPPVVIKYLDLFTKMGIYFLCMLILFIFFWCYIYNFIFYFLANITISKEVYSRCLYLISSRFFFFSISKV